MALTEIRDEVPVEAMVQEFLQILFELCPFPVGELFDTIIWTPVSVFLYGHWIHKFGLDFLSQLCHYVLQWDHMVLCERGVILAAIAVDRKRIWEFYSLDTVSRPSYLDLPPEAIHIVIVQQELVARKPSSCLVLLVLSCSTPVHMQSVVLILHAVVGTKFLSYLLSPGSPKQNQTCLGGNIPGPNREGRLEQPVL